MPTITIHGHDVEFPFTPYASQIMMMDKIFKTVETKSNALLESPTGSGKSLAILCALLTWQEKRKEQIKREAVAELAIREKAAIAAKAATRSAGDAALGQPEAAPRLPDALTGVSEVTTVEQLRTAADDTATSGRDCGASQLDAGGKPTAADARTASTGAKLTSKGPDGKDGKATDKQGTKADATPKGPPSPPTIYFASRTHSQIAQVVKELKRTRHRVNMAVMASRDHYCINRTVISSGNREEACQELLKRKPAACLYFRKAVLLKSEPSLGPGGKHQIHDIEELASIGRRVMACPYFGSREMATTADLVICPYNYIINAQNRDAMGINLEGSVVVFDEAHNIEEAARAAGSADTLLSSVDFAIMELANLSNRYELLDCYQVLHMLCKDLACWMRRNDVKHQRETSEKRHSIWKGDEVVNHLSSFGVTAKSLPIILSSVAKVRQLAKDMDVESGELVLSSASTRMLGDLTTALKYMFSDVPDSLDDYRLCLERIDPRSGGQGGRVNRGSANASDPDVCLHLWSMNAARAFGDVAKTASSVILTSGTLSPMGSFASELGTTFAIQLEAPHVVEMRMQVSAAAISRGPSGRTLNATYRNVDDLHFQDELGEVLLRGAAAIPDGVLCFLPSYSLMDKLLQRWRATGTYSRLESIKPIFAERKGEDVEAVKASFDAAVAGRKAPVLRKYNRSRQAAGRPARVPADREQPAAEDDTIAGGGGEAAAGKRGAILFAVCRGKVSEGINFSDEQARGIFMFGIPFRAAFDEQVLLKREFNDLHRHRRGLLSGSEWYNQEAFRALNQAVGRCIRHRHDYGAIFLVDERMRQPRSQQYISKWLRGAIQLVDNPFDALPAFFHAARACTAAQIAAGSAEAAASAEAPATNATAAQDSTAGLRGDSPAVAAAAPAADSSAVPDAVATADNPGKPDERSGAGAPPGGHVTLQLPADAKRTRVDSGPASAAARCSTSAFRSVPELCSTSPERCIKRRAGGDGGLPTGMYAEEAAPVATTTPLPLPPPAPAPGMRPVEEGDVSPPSAASCVVPGDAPACCVVCGQDAVSSRLCEGCLEMM